MKSIFEEMGGTYRQVGDYLIPNLGDRFKFCVNSKN